MNSINNSIRLKVDFDLTSLYCPQYILIIMVKQIMLAKLVTMIANWNIRGEISTFWKIIKKIVLKAECNEFKYIV